VAARLPLSTLLSQLLVAYTIELDNEFEEQMPHRTTRGPAAHSTAGPWLVSLAMWANFMQYVDQAGTPLRELEPFARMTNLAGLERWGYITVEPDPGGSNPKPPRADWLVRPTRAGRRAQQVWRPLPGLIESRWLTRFGKIEIDTLRESSQALTSQFNLELPRYLPVVKHRLFTELPDFDGRLPTDTARSSASPPDLSVLLSQVLLAFTLDVERESPLSLPTSANVVRVLERTGVRVRDLPRLSGVSKEAIALSLGVLEKGGYAVAEPDPAGSGAKVARLTAKGLGAQRDYQRLLDRVEADWQTRFGTATTRSLRGALEPLVGEPTAASTPLFRGLGPYPDGWRASAERPDTLPHHPIVLHRGGFPDGS
jgi:DNA-binding MarR family transcriptional regulator